MESTKKRKRKVNQRFNQSEIETKEDHSLLRREELEKVLISKEKLDVLVFIV
jgi:hypothetical protein